jgi:Salt stress response/antifungal
MFPLQLLFVFIVLYLLPSNTKSQFTSENICENTTTYAPGSTFEINLEFLSSSLIQNTSNSGFFKTTIGDIPNRIYGSSLCRGDINASDCTICLTTASQDLRQLCPYDRGAIVWYKVCLLRYSNINFFSELDTDGYIESNQQNWSDPYQFEQSVLKMMSLISRDAVQSGKMFSTGMVNLTVSDKIYGLVQCTRDITGDQCLECLNISMQYLEDNYYGNLLGIFLAYSCILWYETDKFFNSDPVLVVPAPSHANFPSVKISPPPETPAVPEELIKGILEIKF